MSSGSGSDDEYVPGAPEVVSEEDSADEETEAQYEDEREQKTKKRTAKQTSTGKKKIKTRNSVYNVDEEEEKEKTHEQVVVSPEEEKKREDDLWAKFLEGTDSKPKTVNDTKATPVTVLTESRKSTNNKSSTKQNDDQKERDRRIFDFAGETVVVENNVVVQKIDSEDKSSSGSKIQTPAARKGAGLTNILDQLSKNNKLSTLEKSKLDWNTFKKDEGIEEEIVSHNKGKAGYLDRKDFLERAEYRQYELERDARMSRRSNR